MYDFFEGAVASRTAETVVLNVSGVGYELLASRKTLESCPDTGGRVKLLAQLIVREDAMLLYGFGTAEEREMFRKLITVTRVGPKLALAILSVLAPTELAIAVMLSDIASLSRVPGIGKKAAERIILELREKVETNMGAAVPAPDGSAGNAAAEAIGALVSLGYSAGEAAQAVNRADAGDGAGVEALVMAALKTLGAG